MNESLSWSCPEAFDETIGKPLFEAIKYFWFNLDITWLIKNPNKIVIDTEFQWKFLDKIFEKRESIIKKYYENKSEEEYFKEAEKFNENVNNLGTLIYYIKSYIIFKVDSWKPTWNLIQCKNEKEWKYDEDWFKYLEILLKKVIWIFPNLNIIYFEWPFWITISAKYILDEYSDTIIAKFDEAKLPL